MTSKRKCGFASMPKEKLSKISRLGGLAAQHEYGTAHRWTSEEAREAGKLSQRNRKKRLKNEQQAK
jgi:hypothetical protein